MEGGGHHKPNTNAALLLTALLVVVAPAANAQISKDSARCRSAIAKGVSKLADVTLKERERCHTQRMLGLLTPSTDCNDPTRSPADTKIVAAVQKLTKTTVRGCARSLSPSSVAYLICPEPCGDLPMATFEDVAGCFACLTEAQVDAALVQAYGAPPVRPSWSAAVSCQNTVGLALRKYFVVRLQRQRKCQYVQDLTPTNIDCRSSDATGKIGAARQKSETEIASCGVALADLDSCANDVSGEQTCVTAAADLDEDALFDAIYHPPVPTPTATPTTTPTTTVSPTVTAASPPTNTPVPSDTPTVVPSATPVPTATPTNLPPVHVDVTPFPAQPFTPPCMIFVHGKQTNTNTFTDWNAARSYWTSGSDDFIRTATKNFQASYYVIGYNGTQAYWDTQAAGVVASAIVNATEGGADGGGNRCAQSFANGGTFWIIGHSMAGTIIDYILGNADPSDPNYNANGPYDVVAQRVSLAVTLGGTHRGSQGADEVCGNGNPLCNFFAQFIQSCDTATFWLQSSDSVQVKTFASAPARTVWLTGGYAAIAGASLCLAGEDDGIVQHASTYACNGSATASYTNDNVCDNNNKQAVSGFKNLDTAHENHDQERNDSHSDTREAIPTGVWVCNGAACSPGNSVQGSMSTARFVSQLW